MHHVFAILRWLIIDGHMGVDGLPSCGITLIPYPNNTYMYMWPSGQASQKSNKIILIVFQYNDFLS